MSWKAWQYHHWLHYRLSSKASPDKILLIPGISSPLEVFDQMINALEAKGYEVLTFDFPGRGLSKKQDFECSLSQLTKLVRDLLTHVGWEEDELTIIGFSWGAGLASYLSLQIKFLVKQLYFIAPTGLSNSFPLAGFMTGLPYFGQRLLMKDFLYGLEGHASHQNFIDQFREQGQKQDFQQALQSSIAHTGFNFESLYQELGRTKIKVAVIAALDDHKFKLKLINRLQEWIPNFKYKLLPRGRHMLPLTNSGEICTHLELILSRHHPDVT